MSKKQEYTAREKQIVWECCKQTAELEEISYHCPVTLKPVNVVTVTTE